MPRSLTRSFILIAAPFLAVCAHAEWNSAYGNTVKLSTQSIALIAGSSTTIQGSAAHDATMSTDSNPLTSSGYAETVEDSSTTTHGNQVSADGDKTRVLVDRDGAVYTRNGPPHQWYYHEDSGGSLTDTTIHSSCGTGMYNYIESITASIGAATAFSMFIEDGTSTKILGPWYLEAASGRGFSIQIPGGRKQSSSATLISVTTSGAVTHSIDIKGFCAP